MIKILFIIPVVYFALLLLLFIFQRSLIYFPTPLNDYDLQNSAPYEQFSIVSEDGLILKSWIAKGDADKKTFVFFHGNAGNAVDRIPMLKVLTDTGHSVVLAEYRGYADNPGSPSEKAIISDAEKLMSTLLEIELVEQDIVLMGRSLGTGVAVNLATKFDVSALILISPYSNLVDLAANTYPYFPVRLLMQDRFDSQSIIKNVTVPIFMFHGENDRIIPIEFGRSLFKEAPEPKYFNVIPAAGHNNLDMNAVNSEIVNFIVDN